MKKQLILITAATFCFAVAPAFAQNPHGGGAGNAGGSHGPAMGNGNAGHGNVGVGASSKGAASSSPTDLLTENSKLDSHLTSKLQSKGLLPAGTDLKDACAGFKSLGQCIAAIHVSHNHDIAFACLKSDMTGTAPATGTTCPAGTGSSKMSLSKSIQALSPKTDSKGAARTATKQSDADIRDETHS